MVNTSQYSESNQCRAESERWLGRLSAEFSGLEMSLACAVGYFISPKDVSVGHMLAAELSFKTKLALLSALFHRHTPNPAARALLKQFRNKRRWRRPDETLSFTACIGLQALEPYSASRPQRKGPKALITSLSR